MQPTEVFHEEIYQTLADILSVRNIYNEILIYGKTESEHNLALFRVLQHLQDCGLTLNLQKRIFSIPQIEQGVAPTQDRTAALLNITRPTTIAEVKSFLGMANFSAYFIPEFSSKTAPLQALTMKNAKFTWSDECKQAFTTTKKELCNAPVMACFNPNRQTKRIVDGSTKTGLFSILTQLDPETQQHQVVHYGSRSAMPQEQKNCQIETKSAAIEFGAIKNHVYLYGFPEFTIILDHKSLVPTYSSF